MKKNIVSVNQKLYRFMKSRKLIISAFLFSLLSCELFLPESPYLDKWNVVYHGSGNESGAVPIDNTEYAEGDTVVVQGNSGNLVFSGKSFTAWNTEADGSGNSYVEGDTFEMGDQPVDLYAVWKDLPKYTINYDGNGNESGSVPVDSGKYLSGENAIILSNTGNLAKSGHSFVGWNTAEDGSGTDYAAGVEITFENKSIVLYAKWTSNPVYQVSYDGNGSDSGTVPEDINNYEKDASVTVRENPSNLGKSGYSFKEWNTAADGSGTSYKPGDSFSMGESDIILYAIWVDSPKYSLVYNANGADSGSVPLENKTYFEGESASLFSNSGLLKKVTCQFNGWNTAADGNGTHYAAGDSLTFGKSNITLYAEWKSVLISLKELSRGIDPFSDLRVVEIKDNLLFQSRDKDYPGELLIYDISNPDNPDLKCSYRDNITQIVDLTLLDSYLLAANNSSLVLLDYSNPSVPVLMSKIEIGNQIRSVFYRDGFVYVVSCDSSSRKLYINAVNYSDVTSPVKQGELEIDDYFYNIELYANGNTLACKANDRHFFIDISDKNDLWIASANAVSQYNDASAGYGNLFYIVQNNKILVYDITDPSNPEIESKDYWNYYSKIAAQENKLIAYDSHTVEIFDTSDPTSLEKKSGELSLELKPESMRVNGSNLAICSDAQSYYIDVSDIDSMRAYNILTDTGRGFDICLAGDTIITSDSVGINLFENGTGYSPEKSSAIQNVYNSGGNIQVKDYVLYAGSQDGFGCYDIKNPSSPQFITTFGSYENYSMVKGDYLYTVDDVIKIFDISTPSSPSLSGGYNDGQSHYRSNLYVSDNLLFTSYSGTAEIFDISDKTSPVLKGTFSITDQTRGFYHYGNYLYHAEWGEDLLIVDISNPSSPVIKKSTSLNYGAEDIAGIGRYLFVDDESWDNISIYDLGDPLNPKLIDRVDSCGSSGNIRVSGDYLLSIDQNFGFAVYEILQ